ncbi:hypothetical protein [Neorhizobium sp. DAR64860/K0K1]|uniref:hypothetical protein n=1 Tax=Neorhizobium sp. DAR64860/K0K1 TaxID=3421955 RepID=UPI003D265642
MAKANMPQPPGGTLTCPPGYRPWITVDNSTREIHAECELGAPPLDPRAAAEWVLPKLDPRDRPKPYSNEMELFRDALKAGKFTGVHFTYLFTAVSNREGDM